MSKFKFKEFDIVKYMGGNKDSLADIEEGSVAFFRSDGVRITISINDEEEVVVHKSSDDLKTLQISVHHSNQISIT